MAWLVINLNSVNHFDDHGSATTSSGIITSIKYISKRSGLEPGNVAHVTDRC